MAKYGSLSVSPRPCAAFQLHSSIDPESIHVPVFTKRNQSRPKQRKTYRFIEWLHN